MSRVSTKKREQQAINKINYLIEQIDNAHSNINDNDKYISWDGTIDFYKGNIDKKENFDYSVDVQIKGRTRYKKKFGEKSYFDLDITDLRNFLKKDGTILFCVEFLSNNDDFKIYYANLLPYDIYHYLKFESTSKTVKIKTKSLKDAKMLHDICEDFNIQKNVQKRISNQGFENGNLEIENNNITQIKFLSSASLSIDDLIGTEHYLYTYNAQNIPVSVNYGFINEIGFDTTTIISDVDKIYFYTNCRFIKSRNDERIEFGNSFVINISKSSFSITLRGTLLERIKDLNFLESIIKNNGFLINDNIFTIDSTNFDVSDLSLLLEKYINIKKKLDEYKMNVDPNIDNWTDKDFYEFELWFNSLNKSIGINLKSDTCFIGSKKINDIRISVLGRKNEEGKFVVETLWNNGIYNKYNFKYSFDEKSIFSNNLFFNLNYDCYLADDINVTQMMDVIRNEENELNNDDLFLINCQLLEILKAYDINQNQLLLTYANFLVDILLKKSFDDESYSTYYINYCQLLKRQNKLSDKDKEKLYEIRNENLSVEHNLSCNILLDNYNEADFILSNMSKSNIDHFKKYPISIFLKK